MLEEYDGLILKLRNAGKESFLFGDLMRDAANVIEELSKENESLGKDLTSAVEMVKKKRKPKWIPVTERLPKKSGDYIVFASGGDWKQLSYLNINFWNETKFFTESGFEVTHWMKLPEPPDHIGEATEMVECKKCIDCQQDCQMIGCDKTACASYEPPEKESES